MFAVAYSIEVSTQKDSGKKLFNLLKHSAA